MQGANLHMFEIPMMGLSLLERIEETIKSGGKVEGEPTDQFGLGSNKFLMIVLMGEAQQIGDALYDSKSKAKKAIRSELYKAHNELQYLVRNLSDLEALKKTQATFEDLEVKIRALRESGKY